jgi:ferric-dicitrate binding protein FerR (iron transport regulator)
MTREQVLDRILDPTGPPLDAARQREFDQWLEREPELKAVFEQQQALFETMDLWETAEPSESFDEAVYARIRRDAEAGPIWRRFLFASWKPSLAAAVAAAAVLIGVSAWDRQPVEQPAQVAVKSAAEAEYYDEIDRALDDVEMLIDFDAFPQPSEPGRS